MKTTKEVVFEFIQKEVYNNNMKSSGLETKDIATSLRLHCSNVSAVLNEPVKEGRLDKSNTRPVYYSLPKTDADIQEIDAFTSLVGSNRSLKNAIQLFVHIACSIERILEGNKLKENKDRNRLIKVFIDDYNVIRNILRPIERTYDLIIDDNELASMIVILKQL